jgi:hypothetical protein
VRQDFDGYVPVQFRIRRAEDCSHATLTEFGAAVVSDGLLRAHLVQNVTTFRPDYALLGNFWPLAWGYQYERISLRLQVADLNAQLLQRLAQALHDYYRVVVEGKNQGRSNPWERIPYFQLVTSAPFGAAPRM